MAASAMETQSMDMNGERLIAAPRTVVWAALNDPETLKACIPGCESIEKLSDTDLQAVVAVKVGPISARFNGKVTLSDIDAPKSYKITGEGQGGGAGFGKGSADVHLTETEGGTTLTYQVNAQVGGKMAQVGSRLIDSVAKSLAETFFTRFSERVAPKPPVVTDSHAAGHAASHDDHGHDPNAPDPSNPKVAGLPIGIWIPMVISIAVIAIVLWRFLG
ncbi:MAG: SRPBCC family protein [Acidiphilium sp.]